MTNAERQALYHAVFLTEAGKECLKDIEKATGFAADPYDPASDRNTAYRLGQHRVVRFIRDVISADLTKEKPKAKTSRSKRETNGR